MSAHDWSSRGITAVTIFLVEGFALAGCGIHTAAGPSIQVNLPVPILVNNVQNPRDVSLALQEYCGNLGRFNKADNTIETLRIPYYTADSAPKLIVPAPGAQADFHSLLDKGATETLKANYGTASGSFSMTDEDRLEVTQNTTAYCLGPDVDKDKIAAAAKNLAAVGYGSDDIVLIQQATLSRMDVDFLLSISKDASAASTPIVNFGGSDFSKNSITATSYFVSLRTSPLSPLLAAPAGSTVGTTVPATAGSAPIVAAVQPGTAPPAATGPATPAGPGKALPPPIANLGVPAQAVVLSPDDFKNSLNNATSNLTVKTRQAGAGGS